jgi:glycosyltransferase involved in cell wall biosynthesis
MKVLIAAPTYLPSRRANTIQVMKMAQAVVLLGHDVLVSVPNPKHERFTNWEILAHHYGLIHKFDVEWIKVRSGLRSYDYGVQAVRSFRRSNADILYTRNPQAAALASILKIPSILEIHDMPGGISGPVLFWLFLRGKGARRAVLITKSLREAITQEIPSLPGHPFTIVEPDGVDLSRYESIPEPEDARKALREANLLELPGNRFTVGYTGHFYTGRGVEMILDMASHIPDVTFVLVGGDPMAVTSIQNKVNRQGLRNVYVTGFVPNVELPRYQAACEVLLMPYQRRVEASSGGDISQYLSPMKLFEYLACGRVILSSHLPVLNEILNGENAILLPPDDVDAWVEAIKGIRNDPVRRKSLAEQARTDSVRFSWESRAERILSFEEYN